MKNWVQQRHLRRFNGRLIVSPIPQIQGPEENQKKKTGRKTKPEEGRKVLEGNVGRKSTGRRPNFKPPAFPHFHFAAGNGLPCDCRRCIPKLLVRLGRQGDDRALPVAQSCTLPYRRLAVGRAWELAGGFRLADALRITNPRYGRVQLCATTADLTNNFGMRGSDLRSNPPPCPEKSESHHFASHFQNRLLPRVQSV